MARRKRAILLVAVLLVLLVAAEIILRLVYFPEFLGTVVRYDPLLGWRVNPNSSLVSVDAQRGFHYRIDVNPLGLREREVQIPKPDRLRRVLILGDTFVFGVGLKSEQRFSDLLDRALPEDVEVINAGALGWSTDQQVLFYESSLRRLQPDLVVLTFLTHNDVVNNGLAAPLVETGNKPHFTCSGDSLIMEPPAPLPSANFAVRGRRLLRQSRLLLWVKRRFEGREDSVREDTRPSTEGYETSRRLSYWSVYDARAEAAMDSAWCVTERLLARLASDCRNDSARLLLFAFPSQLEVEDSWRAEMMRRTGVEPHNIDLALPYRRLAPFCAAHEIAFYYPIDEFRAAAQKQPLYFEHSSHPNAAGNVLAARLLQDEVASSLAQAGR